MHPLLKAWGEIDSLKPPYVLPGDESILPYGSVHSEKSFIQSGLFLDESSAFHFGLYPCPYSGPINTASVYILMLNPGFSLLNIYEEKSDNEYRSELLKQISGNRNNHCFNRRFYWTAAFGYWLRKFKTIIHQIANERHISPKDALDFLSREVAFLELVPYHSQQFNLNPSIINELRSVDLMKSFVQDVLHRRISKGEVTAIVTRKAKYWGLEESKGVVIYSAQEARGAHISTNTRGGSAIIERLRCRYGTPH